MNRKQAAKELFDIQKCYEVKPLKLSTVYRRIFKAGGVWRLIGKPHDYSI